VLRRIEIELEKKETWQGRKYKRFDIP